MNSKKTYIILAVVLAAVLIGAAAGYRAYTLREANAKAEEQSATSASLPEETASEPEEKEVRAGDTVPVAGVSSVSGPEEESPAEAGESSAETGDNSAEAGETPAEQTEENPAEPPAEELPAAADFTVVSAEGLKASLSDFAGKPVIVNFWASWCPPCKAELPHFQEAYEQYGKEIRFMMVDLMDGYRETNTTVQEFLKETGYTFPIFYDRDGSASETYEIYSIPVTLGVTADGKLKYQKIGALNWSDLEEIVEGLTE